MKEKVVYRKRAMVEGFMYQLQKPKQHKRDFGATFMTPAELKAGVKRATKRMAKTKDQDKQQMYLAQAEAYKERLNTRYGIEL